MGARKRRLRRPSAEHLRTEHPAVLTDRDRSDDLGADRQLDRAAKRKRQVDGDLVGRKVEHADAPHEVGRVQDALVATGMVVRDGDLDRSFTGTQLLKRTAPLGGS